MEKVNKSRTLIVRMEPELYEVLLKLAEEAHISISKLVRLILQAHV